MELVTIFQTFNPAEAQLITSRLEAAGFPVHVAHELAAYSMDGYSMATGGVLVQVPDDQAVEARELVTSADRPAE